MAHASSYVELPEVPNGIRNRLIPSRTNEIEEGLRALEYWHPGMFDAIQRTIGMLEAEQDISAVTVDYAEEDALYPLTIWARSTFPLDERLAKVAELEDRTDELLERFPDIVLVAIV